jgi:hypothetical protein
MPARSAFNPFSRQSPLRSFGALKESRGKLLYEGLPYVGPVADYKDDDPDELRPQRRMKGHVAQLDLSKPEDMERYREITQKGCEGQAVLSFEERLYDAEIKSWRVLIRWIELYFAAPDAVIEAAAGPQPPPPRVLPETKFVDVKDKAAVLAKEKTDGSRYATVSEAIHAFGDVFDGEDSSPADPGEKAAEHVPKPV